MRLSKFLRYTTSSLALLALSPELTFAQAATTSDTASAEPTSVEEVVVTGSRLQRSGFEAPTPVTVLSATELKAGAPNDISDGLNFLPQFRGSRTPANAGQGFAASNGANLLSLRGLGSQRTLVLLDGRRIIASTEIGSTDINLLPQDLIGRVDIVTGGASAAYGSDAVAGVVNFVLDKTFVGFKGEVSGGLSRYNDAGNLRGSLAYGTDFAGDRGHLIASAEYSYQDDIAFTQESFLERDWVREFRGLVPNPVSGARPARFIVTDVRHANGSYGGLITSGALKGTTFGPGGTPETFNYGSNVSSVWMTGGDGPFPMESFTSRVERASVFAHADYDVSDTFRVFAEVQASRQENKTAWFYDFMTGQFAMTIFQDNAFLPESIREEMVEQNIASFTLGRFGADMPVVTNSQRNDMRRVVVGFDGDLANGWRYDAYYTHGWNHWYTWATGIRDLRKSYAAVDAVEDPDTGRIVCRSTLADLDPGCKPFNPFGQGSPSQESIDYITGTVWRDARFKQHAAAISVRGDLPISIGSGPVAMAAGLEYRKEQADETSDPLSQSRVDFTGIRGAPASLSDRPGGWLLSNPQPLSGSYDVKEAFLELGGKVLEDVPLVNLLDVEAAVRGADYSGTGLVYAWKMGMSYSPFEDLRFRLTRSRDIRAANIVERFSARQQAALNFVTDPRTGTQVSYQGIRSGNPNLDPEEADTTTLGVVYQPSWLPGLNLSVDLYDIEINDAIAALSPQTTMDQCYKEDVALACAQIKESGGALTIELPFLNLASQTARGVDFEAAYARELAGGRLELRAFVSEILEATSKTPGAAAIDSTELSGKWRGLFTAAYSRGPISVFVQERYIGEGLYNATFVEGVDIDDNSLPAVWYTDVTTKVKIGDGRKEVFATINNLFDKEPPSAPQASTFQTGTNKALYDIIGRYYTVGFRFRY